MKKISILLVLFILNGNLFSQKLKSKKITYEYSMFPNVKYGKDINSFYIQEKYETNFLKGKLNVENDKEDIFLKKYSISNNDKFNFQINGLNKTTNKGLRIEITYRSVGRAVDLVSKMNKVSDNFSKKNSSIALMNKPKYTLLFAELKVYEGDNLIHSKSFSRKCLYKSEYLQFYKDKKRITPYKKGDYKIKFNDIETNALYFVFKDMKIIKVDIKKYLNKKIGFNTQRIKLKIYKVKSKKHDYLEMNNLQGKVVDAIKKKDKAKLREYYKNYTEMIKKADYDNEDAKYNKHVAAALFVNAYSICVVTEDLLSVANLHILIIWGLKKFNQSELKEIYKLKDELKKIQNNRTLNKHRKPIF